MILFMLLVVAYLIFLCWLLLAHGADKTKSRNLFVSIIILAVWILMVFGLNSSLGTNLYFARSIFAVGLLCIASFVRFISCFNTKKKYVPQSLKKWFYLIFGIFLLVICFTPLIIEGVVFNGANNLPMPIYGQYVWLYYLAVIFLIIFIAYSLFQGSKVANKKTRSQIKIVAASILLAAILATFTNIIVPNLTNSSLSSQYVSISGLIMATGMSYAIARYGLFDIKQTIVRAVAYVLSLATLSVAYYFIALIISTLIFKVQFSASLSVNPINIALALVLAFIFQPVKRFFDKYTNKFFYKEHYNSEDFFARLNKTLAVTTDLRDLLERTAIEIGRTLKSEQAFFFINTLDGHYVSSGTLHHKQLSIGDAFQLKSSNNLSREVLVASLMDSEDSVRRLMLSRRIELILPLIRSNKCVGFLCLGDHLTSGYTNRDIKVLNTISNALIIAIQNALAVQEIREFNETLKQQIANATKELRTKNIILQQLDKAKDEFVGMASHQLRTPLTSIKGYISMVLEGDAGKISDSQAQLLNEAFNSSERMVRLINDFLNVSRLQTGKFMIDKRPVDLSKVVEQEIDSLQSNAVVHNMKFAYELPKDFPMINIDEGKMRQVIMNFADNAIYYSHDDSTISINLSVDKNNIIFTVKDNGIGVPADEQPKLFSKFYRASNARKQRPDGTGVGLYLAKKIIIAHDGKVIFNSTEGKGSTFGFSLPLKQS